MNNPTDDALAVLGLGPGATADEIREAYRDLAKVWHPDRFGDDPRLRAKAEDRLKAINAAHQALVACIPASRRSDARRDRAPRAPQVAPATSQQPPRHRSTVAVKNRHVRMPLPRVEVRFGEQAGWLLNLSLTGGQLLLDSAPVVGSETTILLRARQQVLALKARVIRVSAAPSTAPLHAGSHQWTVSVAFVDLPPHVQQSIPRFYNILLAESR